MIIRNHTCVGGTQILEYVTQNDADVQQIAAWMLDGTIPAEASQADPDRLKLAQTFAEQESGIPGEQPAAV